MASSTAISESGNVFSDLSGVLVSQSDNPYDALIDVCAGDPNEIQDRYQKHRKLRNEQQRAKIVSYDFEGFIIDPILSKLIDTHANAGYVDPRNCLVLWARPPGRIRNLVCALQTRLLEFAPNVWLMPLECLHMTVLEVTHSKTEAEIEHLVSVMNNSIPRITDFTFEHRARLVKPMLSYDATAIALSFVPAASEMPTTSDTVNGNDYTYHHLRRDIYALSKGTGVEIASRYVVPSAHLTIARFVSQKDISGQNGMILDTAKVKKIVEGLETINIELETKHRPKGTGDWTVGEEKGLDCRKGRLWYGGGQTVHLGKGF